MLRDDGPLRWLHRLTPEAVDVFAAAAIFLAAVALDLFSQQSVLAIAVGLVIPWTVAFRRRAPVLAALVGIVGSGAIDNYGGHQSVLPVVVALNYYMVGRRTPRWNLTDAVVLFLPLPGIATDPSTAAPGDPLVLSVLSVWGFFMVIPFLAGRMVSKRVALVAKLRAGVRRLEHEQREHARQASAGERARIARELHDVVAHSVSVMVIQTGAARSVARADPEAARAALVAVQGCGHDALRDLERMVGVLDSGEPEPFGGACPTLEPLYKLVERARDSGLPVAMEVVGEPRELSPGLDLVVYRTVQEALTNTIKHAGPAKAYVRVHFGARRLEIEVIDTGRGSASGGLMSDTGGLGLTGMRERLALYGGWLEAGHRVGAGFEVRAGVPLGGDVLA